LPYFLYSSNPTSSKQLPSSTLCLAMPDFDEPEFFSQQLAIGVTALSACAEFAHRLPFTVGRRRAEI
jgi:hypothetical protein